MGTIFTRVLLCLAVLGGLLNAPPGLAASPGPRFDAATTEMVASGADRIAVVIRYVSPPTDADGRDLLAAGFRPGLVRFEVVPAVAAVGPASAVAALKADPRIAYVEHDAKIPYTLDRATAAGRARQIWDATYELADEVHTGGFTGRGIGIAIVDSGIDATHPDLIWKPFADAQGAEPKTTANFKIEGRDSAEIHTEVPGAGPFLEANMLAVDVPHSDNTGGHGTHVAGIAAGNGAASDGRFKGAAPGADLIGYGAGEVLVVSMGLAAFDHIHRHHAELGIRVVNNSWGGAGEWDPERAVTQAARRLVNDDGLVVVFAAGNSGGDGSDIQSSVWGNIPEVIQVANYYDRTGWLDSSSSRGRKDREDTWPDVAASGTQVISTAALGGPVSYYGSVQDALLDELIGGSQEPTVVPAPLPATVGNDEVLVGNYASLTGTSMAAPFVAGVAALILEANPGLDPFEVRGIMRETANMPVGRTYGKDGYAIGRGVIDAAEAVAVALRMREGLPLDEAVAAAYVDTSAEPYKLNLEDPRHFEITAPQEGDEVHTALEVSGRLVDGPATDNSIPLAPTSGSEASSGGTTSASVSGGSLAQATLLTQDFESESPEGWTVEQHAPPGPGLLTEWRSMAGTQLAFYGPHSGDGWFAATAAPAPGEFYTDMSDTSLVSPLIDLSDIGTANASYWRAGASEGGFDFFETYVEPVGGEPVLLERLSGTLLLDQIGDWSRSPDFDLSDFSGQQVRLRFRFTSDEPAISPFAINLPGWSVDDVEVTGEPGVPAARLSVTPSFGVAPLDTTFTYGYPGASSFVLEFGDGATHVADAAGSVAHTYGAGIHTARLSVRDEGGAEIGTAEVTVEVAPSDVVQMRLVHGDGATAWTDVGRSEDGTFAHTFSLGSVPTGTVTLEARHFAGGRTTRRSVTVEAIEAPPSEGPDARDDTAKAVSGKTVKIDVLANDVFDGTVTVTTADRSTNGGKLAVGSAGKVRYRPPARFTGTDTFTYTITDADGDSDSATVTVDVRCSKGPKKRNVANCKKK